MKNLQGLMEMDVSSFELGDVQKLITIKNRHETEQFLQLCGRLAKS